MFGLFSMMFLSCDTKGLTKEQSTKFTYKKALLLAKKENKIILLKITSKGCHFCKKMDEEVLKNKEVLAILDKNFILVEIDVNKDILPLELEYKVTPTFFFISDEEKIISKIPGSWNKNDFIDLLEMALKRNGEER